VNFKAAGASRRVFNAIFGVTFDEYDDHVDPEAARRQ
jgi:acyl dehydratase